MFIILSLNDWLTPKQLELADRYIGRVVDRKKVCEDLGIGEKTYYRYVEKVREVVQSKYDNKE